MRITPNLNLLSNTSLRNVLFTLLSANNALGQTPEHASDNTLYFDYGDQPIKNSITYRDTFNIDANSLFKASCTNQTTVGDPDISYPYNEYFCKDTIGRYVDNGHSYVFLWRSIQDTSLFPDTGCLDDFCKAYLQAAESDSALFAYIILGFTATIALLCLTKQCYNWVNKQILPHERREPLLPKITPNVPTKPKEHVMRKLDRQVQKSNAHQHEYNPFSSR